MVELSNGIDLCQFYLTPAGRKSEKGASVMRILYFMLILRNEESNLMTLIEFY